MVSIGLGELFNLDYKVLFAGGWSFLNRFLIMLKQSAAQSYLPGAAKIVIIFFKFFYVDSATNREGALWSIEASSSANTSGDLKQNWLLFYRISVFMHL